MKQFRTGLFMFGLLFALLIIGQYANSSAQATKKTKTAKTLLVFEKKPCFGFCPVYKAEFLSDGTVNVTAQPFAKPKQTSTFKITPEAAKTLWQRGEKLGFFQMKEKYETLKTDFPVKEIALYRNGNPKKVSYTEGASEEFESYLFDLAELVEKNLDVNFGPAGKE